MYKQPLDHHWCLLKYVIMLGNIIICYGARYKYFAIWFCTICKLTFTTHQTLNSALKFRFCTQPLQCWFFIIFIISMTIFHHLAHFQVTKQILPEVSKVNTQNSSHKSVKISLTTFFSLMLLPHISTRECTSWDLMYKPLIQKDQTEITMCPTYLRRCSSNACPRHK
jgi:hypothetical protein